METSFKIQNLKCGGCANTITRKLSKLKDVKKVNVNNESNLVSLSYENDNTLIEVKRLLHNIGYPVIGENNAITTKAKSFVSCAIGRMSS